ncbi:MAG: tetratricopeptide repeat protein, partial [Firmicutes bacterium]|nr:tetratricopeptide repeat protein [Bacillota bacterium]
GGSPMGGSRPSSGRSGGSGGGFSSGSRSSGGGGGWGGTSRTPAAPRRTSSSRGSAASNAGSFVGGMVVGSMLGGNRNRRPPRRNNRSPAPRPSRNTGGGMGSAPMSSGSANRGCGSGCLKPIIYGIIIIVIIVAVSQMLSGGGGVASNAADANLTVSTIERTALPLNAADSTAPWLVDNLGWIGNQATLQQGLTLFHQRTGVRPLVYITDNINGNENPNFSQMQSYAEDAYVEIIGGNPAHLLLLFMENSAGDYEMWITVGSQALTVMDSQAQDILLDFVQRFYYEDVDEATMFSMAFDSASERIMTVHQEPSLVPVFVIIGVIILAVILFMWWQQRQKQKNLEAAQTAEILSTPLEEFDKDDAASALAKQYEDD